ncbi:serine protease [Thalassobacillus devorans]|uniref:Serine protease n=1 Tax=Thalassobacillus devorans TaxID=279813 RepID=A0ABQ1P312_9BACI|nr:S8 family peptidase [Thalassobacillus devorans]NIK28207.1 hypothetical protein [Thalassobacillus devorans]GGC88066.1 serine protease [Thalassobacillus devorans]
MERPLLFFSEPSLSSRDRRPFPPRQPHIPSSERQTVRIEPKLQSLVDALDRKSANLSDGSVGFLPEETLVFEIIGSIDQFVNAVRKIEGLEWLCELEESFEPDEDFYLENDGEKEEKELNGRLYFIMTDQTALQQLIGLWEIYKTGEKLPHGLGRWKHLFAYLRDIRNWNINDRLDGTGLLEDWQERVDRNEEVIQFEIELWFRSIQSKRDEVYHKVKSMIEECNGEIIQETVIENISYHGILVSTPINVFEVISESDAISFIRSEHIMFFRPIGQISTKIPHSEEHLITEDDRSGEVMDDPIIALFDGLPIENHELLRDRIKVDDPDNLSTDYNVTERRHGTSMASLIIHGELDEESHPLNRKIYVRPIMKPNERDFSEIRSECMPLNTLPIDLVYKAVKRLFEGDEEGEAVAPNVKIINLSIGDMARPFDRFLSPWARLLDWLSFKYNVLFIVSAGNFIDHMVLNVRKDEFNSLTPENKEVAAIKTILQEAQHRRILTPSESINALTVGASHYDSSSYVQSSHRLDIFSNQYMLSPISRLGLGHRRSIKPEILMPGGKQLYQEDIVGRDGLALLRIVDSLQPPGQRVALPGTQGHLNKTGYTRGTSNSTALATRNGALLYDELLEILGENKERVNITLLIKALLVHGASWESTLSIIEGALNEGEKKNLRDRIVPRLIGYGVSDITRILEPKPYRATIIGTNKLTKDEAHEYTIPLPPSLSSKDVWRRLTITLAWFSPVNALNQKYRQAKLSFTPPQEDILVTRTEADHNSVKRGTLQHEILEGEQAVPFVDGSNLEIKVNCQEDAGGLGDIEVPYSLVVTFEVAEGVDIEVYNEIRERIIQPVRVQ